MDRTAAPQHEDDQPEIDVLRGFGLLAAALLVVAAVWAVAVLILSLERQSIAKCEPRNQPRRILTQMPAAAPEWPLASPLACDATLVVKVAGRITQRPECYVANRVWL